MKARIAVVTVPIFWVLLATFSAPAMAWVEICNSRGDRTTAAVALGAMDAPGVSTGGHTGVTVEGWWPLTPGECATARCGELEIASTRPLSGTRPPEMVVSATEVIQ